MALDIDTIAEARAEIAQIYIAAFNRVPDAAGLSNWLNQYTAGLMTYAQIAEDFTNQAEYQAKYPSLMTNTEYVTEIYQNVFGRAPDAGGLTNWTNQLDHTSITGINRGNIMKLMLDAAGATGNTDGERLDNQASFAVQSILDGISTDTATAQLANITSDSATVATALTAATTANAVGTTYTLTKGVNDGALFTGTTGNDTFNANYDAEGAAAHTLGALDVLNGGDGTDTLAITSDNGTTGYTLAAATISNIENMTIRGSAAVTADVSGSNVTGLNTISVTQATQATLTAGETTAVSVSGIASGTWSNDGDTTNDVGGVTIAGGSTQTVTLANKLVSVSLTDAAGAISVTSSNNETDTTVDANDTVQTSDITTTHGTTVTVNATLANTTTTGKTAGKITVGDGTDNQSGAVSVTQNLTSDGDATLTGGAITVNGGTTVNVTTNATTTAQTGTSNANITVGTVNVIADNNTTAVTVKAVDTVSTTSTAAVGGSTETASVAFGALKEGDALSIGGLKFTAAKDLTAAEVAAAFANITASDKQSAGTVANGTYTLANGTSWTSAAASGATVVFTSTTANSDVANLTATLTNTSTNSVAPTITTTNGAAVTTAATGPSTNAVTFGTVNIGEGGNQSITSVSVEGYAAANIGAGGLTDLNSLTTLSLTDSTGTATVATAATTLDLTVNDVLNTVDLDNTAATVANLTVNAATAASTFALTAIKVEDLTINANAALNLTGSAIGNNSNELTNVTITGASAVTLGTVAQSTGLKSFDASANTGGVSATIVALAGTGVHADITAFEFSAGNDTVTVSNATVNEKINLNGGDDSITIAGATLGAVIDGGTGTNTLGMTSANAATASATTTFEANITNFTKLSLAQTLTTATDTVDLANIDDISYVISANTYGSSTNQTETAVVTFTDLTAGQTITIDGVTMTAVANATAAQVAEAFDDTAAGLANVLVSSGVDAGAWTAADNSGAATVTFTSASANQNVSDLNPTEGNAGQGTNATTTTGAVTAGTGASDEKVDWDFTGAVLAVGQQLTFNGYTITAKAAMAAADVANDFALAAGVATGTAAKSVASGAFAALTDDLVDGTWTLVGNVLTITDAAGTNANVDSSATAALTIIRPAAATTPTALAVSTTQGAGAATNGSLTLTNMADNGTLELTGAGAGVTVTMTDATGSTDKFNIVTKVTSTDLDFGKVTVAGVETINISSDNREDDNNDGTISTAEAASVEKATVSIAADKATTINVVGDSAVALTLDATSTKVATVDATDLTGALTFTATGASTGVTVIGGSGADVLTSSGENDVLKGNDGNDSITATDLAQIYGGNGADQFYFNVMTNLTKVSTIHDIGSGDVIHLVDNGTVGAGTVVDKFYSAGAQYNASTTTDVAGKVNAALAQTGEGEASWFNHGGNTYIVIDADDASNIAAGATDTYQEGQDIVIEIIGTFNLSTAASFNATNGTLEII